MAAKNPTTRLTSERLAALLTPDVALRFWSKVAVGGPSECWHWKAGVDKDGYGKFQISLGGSANQLHVRSHRIAHFLTTDEVPPGVLHRCDTPPCCNPAHLFGGTQGDNRADCTAKGRNAKTCRRPFGEKASRAKLTDAQVAEIQRRYVPRVGVGALAREFGISPTTVSEIGTGRYRRLINAAALTARDELHA